VLLAKHLQKQREIARFQKGQGVLTLSIYPEMTIQKKLKIKAKNSISQLWSVICSFVIHLLDRYAANL
jgi:hypothetical protein